MPPISNSDRLEMADRPRRETRIVYTREDRRPIRERARSGGNLEQARSERRRWRRIAGASPSRRRRQVPRKRVVDPHRVRTNPERGRVPTRLPCLGSPCLALDRHRRRIYRCRSTCARSPRSPSREEPRMQARASRGPRESDSRLAAALRLIHTRELRIYACRVAYARFATWYNYYVKYRDIPRRRYALKKKKLG